MPPVALPRRMSAGSQLTFHAPIRVGDAVRRVSTMSSIEEKDGRTGALIFVKVRHQVFCNGAVEPALTEFHDIVYRPAAQAGAAAPAPMVGPSAGGGREPSCLTMYCCPVFGADFQRAPHPLPPPACICGGGLSRSGGAWAAHRDADDGPVAARTPARRGGEFRVSCGAAFVRSASVFGAWRYRRRRSDWCSRKNRTPVGAGP